MKFASFALIGLIHLTSAQDNNNFGLRAASAVGRLFASQKAVASTTINTSVLVEGVDTQAVTAEDMDLIDQSVETAFHQVYDDGETHHGRNLQSYGGSCGGWVSRSFVCLVCLSRIDRLRMRVLDSATCLVDVPSLSILRMMCGLPCRLSLARASIERANCLVDPLTRECVT